MKCLFCEKTSKDVPQFSKTIIQHLIVTMNDHGHIHVHGPIENKRIMDILISGIKDEMEKQSK